jgi:hypothetical protein
MSVITGGIVMDANVLKDNLLSKIETERQWILENIAFNNEQLVMLDRMEAEIESKQLELNL